MAIYPLYTSEQEVSCSLCCEIVGKASKGVVIGFGDSNGNRELPCVCDRDVSGKTYFDVTKSKNKAKKFMEEHEAGIIEFRRFNLGQFAKQGARWAIDLMATKPAEKAAKKPAKKQEGLFDL